MKRLKRIALRRRVSIQQFVEAVVLREMAEEDDSLKREKMDRDEILAANGSRKPDTTASKLGIMAHLKQQDQKPQVSDSPTPAPVVVNVGQQTASSGGDIIERLSSFVIAGNDFERSTRLRTAVGIIKDTTTSEEEQKVLAARLDEAIAAKTNTTTPTNGNSIAARTVRVAFDKLAGLLNK